MEVHGKEQALTPLQEAVAGLRGIIAYGPPTGPDGHYSDISGEDAAWIIKATEMLEALSNLDDDLMVVYRYLIKNDLSFRIKTHQWHAICAIRGKL